MKQSFFSLFFLSVFLLIVGLTGSLGAQNFDGVVQFDVGLAGLDSRAQVESAAQDGRIVILEGLMGDAVVEENGRGVWVSLIGGSWVSSDEVRAYGCMVHFKGTRFAEVFPGVVPKDPSPDYVPQGSRLLIAAQILRFDEVLGMARAEMVDYRVLD